MYVDVAAMPSQDRGSTPLTSTIEFHALPLRALFLCPQPCHQLPVFERVAELSFLLGGGHGKRRFPLKTAKMGLFFLRFLRLEDRVLPRAEMRSHSHKRTKNTTHMTRVMEKTSSNNWRVCL